MFISFTSSWTQDDYKSVFQLLSLSDSFINRKEASANITADIYRGTLHKIRSYRRIVPRQDIVEPTYVEDESMDIKGNNIHLNTSVSPLRRTNDDYSDISQPRHRSYMENMSASETVLTDNDKVGSQSICHSTSSPTLFDITTLPATMHHKRLRSASHDNGSLRSKRSRVQNSGSR